MRHGCMPTDPTHHTASSLLWFVASEVEAIFVLLQLLDYHDRNMLGASRFASPLLVRG